MSTLFMLSLCNSGNESRRVAKSVVRPRVKRSRSGRGMRGTYGSLTRWTRRVSNFYSTIHPLQFSFTVSDLSLFPLSLPTTRPFVHTGTSVSSPVGPRFLQGSQIPTLHPTECRTATGPRLWAEDPILDEVEALKGKVLPLYRRVKSRSRKTGQYTRMI